MTKRRPNVVGNYRFTGRTLGKGNFAKVEEASHEVLGIKVAIKIMDINIIKEDYVIRNLYREAKIMSKLRHPCIACLFETMQRTDNTYYLVTEIVGGGDLCTYVKAQRYGKLEERTTKIFAQQFVSALSYMHQRGIVHRDLKMENVMLNTDQNQIKIVDFGLSNEWSIDAPLKTHCGSPEYAAPELFVTSRVYGPEVDLWSLGIILYGMAVGQLPFISNKVGNITSQERRKILVSQINKGLALAQKRAIAMCSFEFRNVLSRLLNADSTKRITIKELLIHPWITENGKRFVRANPIKKLNNTMQNKIITDISALTGASMNEIVKRVREEPFGKAGGMYNILIHKNLIKPFSAELITRCLAAAFGIPPTPSKKEELSTTRHVYSAQSKTRPISGKPRAACSPSASELRRSKHSLAKAPSPATFKPAVVRSTSPVAKSRPKSSMQFSRSKNDHVPKPASSALAKRQEYAATVTPKLPKTPHPSKRSSSANCEKVQYHAPKTTTQGTQTKDNDTYKVTHKAWISPLMDDIDAIDPRKTSKANEVRVVRTNQNELCILGNTGPEALFVRKMDCMPLKPSTSSSQRNPYTSATNQKRHSTAPARPATSCHPKVENAQKSPNKHSVVPVIKSRTTLRISQTRNQPIGQSVPPTPPLETCDSARGDCLTHRKTSQQPIRENPRVPMSRLCSNPIARKIAIFVGNNLRCPNRMTNKVQNNLSSVSCLSV